jgi:histidinol phosphatase-like PHP family hydrolase
VEHLRRAEVHGYEAIALTDHVDLGNLPLVVPALVRACESYQPHTAMLCIPGVEVTHVPPTGIREVVEAARRLGARLVVVHGETTHEPVAEGTNRAAIEARCDILAHPGFITTDELQLAKVSGVLVELSAKAGHSLTNGYLASVNRHVGAGLVVNSDAHGHADFLTASRRRTVVLGAGLDETELAELDANAARLVAKLVGS